MARSSELTTGHGNCRVIRFYEHDVLVNLRTADVSARKTWNKSPKRPPYEKNATCPSMNRILHTVFGLSMDPEEMMRHFWEVVGYLLMPSDIARFSFVFYGPSNSGKHEMAEVLKSVVDTSSVVFHATPPQRVWTDEQLEYTVVLPFPGVFSAPADSPQIPVYLWDMAGHDVAGIAWSALVGLQRLLIRGRFYEPEECQQAKRQYFRSVDIVGSFLDDCIVLVDDNAVRVRMADLWRRFRGWYGPTMPHISMRQFVAEVASRGILYGQDGKGRRLFYGMAFRSD